MLFDTLFSVWPRIKVGRKTSRDAPRDTDLQPPYVGVRVGGAHPNPICFRGTANSKWKSFSFLCVRVLKVLSSSSSSSSRLREQGRCCSLKTTRDYCLTSRLATLHYYYSFKRQNIHRLVNTITNSCSGCRWVNLFKITGSSTKIKIQANYWKDYSTSY